MKIQIYDKTYAHEIQSWEWPPVCCVKLWPPKNVFCFHIVFTKKWVIERSSEKWKLQNALVCVEHSFTFTFTFWRGSARVFWGFIQFNFHFHFLEGSCHWLEWKIHSLSLPLSLFWGELPRASFVEDSFSLTFTFLRGAATGVDDTFTFTFSFILCRG